MDVEVDHYDVLGLPSGEEGSRISEKEINKTYRCKARELHPDKRRNDPDAHANFLKLQTSYSVLKDEKARKLFDDLLRVKREKIHRQGQRDSKRRKMMSDLEEKERSAFAVDPSTKGRQEEERIARKLKEEIARIRAMHASKMSTSATSFEQDKPARGKDNGLDKGKVVKVSWEKIGEEYTAQGLREIFEEFGDVEDVVIKSFKKKGSALVVMASKDDAIAATGNVLGNLSNPLLVLPLQPDPSPVAFSAEKNEHERPKLSNLVGARYQAFENSVLEKMKKAAERQRIFTFGYREIIVNKISPTCCSSWLWRYYIYKCSRRAARIVDPVREFRSPRLRLEKWVALQLPFRSNFVCAWPSCFVDLFNYGEEKNCVGAWIGSVCARNSFCLYLLQLGILCYWCKISSSDGRRRSVMKLTVPFKITEAQTPPVLLNTLVHRSTGVRTKLQYLNTLERKSNIGGVSASRMAWSLDKCDGNTVEIAKMGFVRPATEDYAQEAIEAVRAGEVIAVPTDTLYGFACDACSMEAVHRIYEIKGRKHTSPLAICVADVHDIQRFAITNHLPHGLLDSLLPGPVTVVLRRGDSSILEKSLNPGLDSIGVRVPDCEFIRSIARGSNSALALTSANLSGQPSSVDVKDFESLWPHCAYIYNGGVLPSGRAGSTVVDLTTLGKYKILRPGSAKEETVGILQRYGLVEDSSVS